MKVFMIFLGTIGMVGVNLAPAVAAIPVPSGIHKPTDGVEHGGRTDKSGCHRDRKNGTRHCH